MYVSNLVGEEAHHLGRNVVNNGFALALTSFAILPAVLCAPFSSLCFFACLTIVAAPFKLPTLVGLQLFIFSGTRLIPIPNEHAVVFMLSVFNGFQNRRYAHMHTKINAYTLLAMHVSLLRFFNPDKDN